MIVRGNLFGPNLVLKREIKKLFMKKIILAFAILITSQTTNGQSETSRLQEIGLGFNNFNAYSLIYRSGTETALWRFSAGNLVLRNAENSNDSLMNYAREFDISLSAGREYRNRISEKMEFRYGFDLGLGFSSDRFLNQSPAYNGYEYFRREQRYSIGASAVIGLNYRLSDDFILGAELLPTLNYAFGQRGERNGFPQSSSEGTTDISEWSFIARNGFARLSLMYQF